VNGVRKRRSEVQSPMGSLIHYRLADGTILAGPVSSPAYSLWTRCCVRGCSSWFQMPGGPCRPSVGNTSPGTPATGGSSTSGDWGKRRGKNTYAGWRTTRETVQRVGTRSGNGFTRNTATRSIPTTGFRWKPQPPCASRGSCQPSNRDFFPSPAARF